MLAVRRRSAYWISREGPRQKRRHNECGAVRSPRLTQLLRNFSFLPKAKIAPVPNRRSDDGSGVEINAVVDAAPRLAIAVNSWFARHRSFGIPVLSPKRISITSPGGKLLGPHSISHGNGWKNMFVTPPINVTSHLNTLLVQTTSVVLANVPKVCTLRSVNAGPFGLISKKMSPLPF